MRTLETEWILWQKVETLPKGPSHDKEHLERVISYGLALQKIHGGDPEIIKAAAIFHDLGRVDTKLRGKESALESAHLARPILEQAGFPEGKIDHVCQVIAEHDQPEVRPTTSEGRILKDADFLDGFGARGILRSLLWTGERGKPLEEALERLRVKMPARIAGLEFPESKKIARKQYRFVELFLSLLEQPVSLETEQLTGKYIVFEGTSGTGKETQARKLVEELEAKGVKVRLVFEPTPDTKPVLAKWREEVDDHLMELFFYIADRRRIMEKEVLPALRSGEIVVSVRSWISTLVYQTETKQEETLTSFLHTFVLDPDLILWVDVAPEEALNRIGKRHRKTGEPFSKFEELEKLKLNRDKYRRALERFENVVRIDGAPSPEAVHQKVMRVLEQFQVV